VNTINKWAERVYAETDFGRSVATSVSGLVGLVVYLTSADWVIAAFCTIISFPIIRLIAAGSHEKRSRRATRRIEREEAEQIYDRLSDDEKQVVLAFVRAGGSVLTWGQVNRLPLSGPAVESLIQRKVLWPSVTANGLRETFALDSAVFDVGRDRSQGDDLPFCPLYGQSNRTGRSDPEKLRTPVPLMFP